jgi:bifunctional non-homologous end joining protein LigD
MPSSKRRYRPEKLGRRRPQTSKTSIPKENNRMIGPLLPMLAVSASPFDSEDYFFEVKWDGVRALAAVEGGQWNLWGRKLADYRDRYPELDVLRRLPSGTIVDGELVMFNNDRPDLSAILRRHQLVHAARIRHAGLHTPVHYVLFDIPYYHGRSLMQVPFARRRSILTDALTELKVPQLALSEGTANSGRDFFERVVATGHEGVMAKHQSSRYLPGQRSAAWKKIKPVQILPCVIIGYTPCRDGLHSLLVANAHHGALRYVGQITSGFSNLLRAELARRLALKRRPRPVVDCPRHACWVEPELYCRVRFLQWTSRGHLRGASFAGLIEESA